MSLTKCKIVSFFGKKKKKKKEAKLFFILFLQEECSFKLYRDGGEST